MAANPPIASSARTGINIDLPTTQVAPANRRAGHAAGDESVQLQVLQDRAGVYFAHAGEEVAHQPDARLGEVAGRLAQIRRPNAHVGIADQDHVVLAMGFHRGQALDLGIEPESRTADDELGVVVGKLALQFLNDLDGRVVRLGDAKEKLVTMGSRAGKSCAGSARALHRAP